jgi:hypothetical protein
MMLMMVMIMVMVMVMVMMTTSTLMTAAIDGMLVMPYGVASQ